MANKQQKLYSDVVRIRNQVNWEKIRESLKILKAKHGASDPILKLVEAEAELELFLLDNEPCPDNNAKAQKKLLSVKKRLSKSDVKTDSFDVCDEAALLLAKLHFTEGNLSACFDIYKQISLPRLKVDALMYKKKIFYEAFAIKGFCLENRAELSKNQEQVEEAMECYERSTDYLLLYLTELDKVLPLNNTLYDDNIVGFFSQKAIHQYSVLAVNTNNVWKAVKLLRDILKFTHTTLPLHAQQAISLKLALILLRGTSTIDYRKEKSHDKVEEVSYLLAKRKKSEFVDSSDDSPLANEKPKFFLGEKKYRPGCLEQEVLLLLLISEIMMNVDPVLDMSPEHANSRDETLANAESLYDLLAIVCTYLGQFDMLTTAIEKSLKYSFDRDHIWQQYALSLTMAGKRSQALSCLSECCNIKTTDPTSALIAAKLCYEEIPPDFERGIEFSKLAVKMSAECFDKNDGMRSRAHLSVGVGQSIKAIILRCRRDRFFAHQAAISAYKKAHSADPFDDKPLLYLAFEYAVARKIPAAFVKVKQGLALQPQSLYGQHLLILLLTARGSYDEAKQTLDAAILMYPDDIRLLSTKTKLAVHVGNVAEALCTCDEIIRIWGGLPELSLVDSGPEKGISERMSGANASFGGDLEAGSVAATSAAASRFGQTTSVTSSLADLLPKTAVRSSLRAEAWLHVAEVYLAAEKIEDAEKCILEATNINPLLPSAFYMKGRICHHLNQLDEACAMYKNTLIIDPFHVKAQEYYCQALLDQNKLNLAKKLSQDVILQDTKAHKIWQILAEILERQEDVDGAIECTTFALKLEETAPVVPFSTLLPFV